MKNLNAERTNSSKNKKLSSIYSDEKLREYLMRINKAATYQGNNDCENVPIILREFIKGYENKIFELENRLKECENGYEGTLALERAKVKDLTEEKERLRAEKETLEIYNADYKFKNKELTAFNRRWAKESADLQDECEQIKENTVRKMQERLKEAPIKVGLPLFGLQTKDEVENYTYGLISQMGDAIDQIAKEMLEGGK